MFSFSFGIVYLLFLLKGYNGQNFDCVLGNANIANSAKVVNLYNSLILRTIPNYRITNFFSFCTRNVGNLLNINFDADILNNNLNYNIKNDLYVMGQTIMNSTIQLALRSQINQIPTSTFNTQCLSGNATIKSNQESVRFFNNFARFFPINSVFMVSNYRSFCFNNVAGTTRGISLDTDVVYTNCRYRLTVSGCFGSTDAPITAKVVIN